MKEEQIPAIRAGGREWIGLAALVLQGCGLSREELRTAVTAGDDEVLRRVWNCVAIGWPAGA
jgi:hypothetical protein